MESQAVGTVTTFSSKKPKLLKTLSDKSREAKAKNKPRTVPCLPKYSAGLELLSRYEDTWAALHRRAKECASAGERVDSEVVMLSAHWEKKQASLRDLQQQLQQLPGLIADLESLTASLTHLEASFEEVENHLLNLEDLCGQCELERHKHMQSQQLEDYKKNKRKELETFKAELDAEHSQKVLEMEQTQQLKLKERQKFFEEAFQQDMEQYLSTGYLQIAERRATASWFVSVGKEGSPCSSQQQLPAHRSLFHSVPEASVHS